MKVQPTYKNIWSISYPIILGSLATTVLNLTDTAFISRVGETELGAMAITSVFYFLSVMAAFSIGIGAQILMARRAGEGNSAEIGKLFDHTFIILAGMGLISFILVHYFSADFFSMILKSPKIIDACNAYMAPRNYGIIFAMTSIAFRSFYIAISQTRVITYSSVILLVLNVILDYLLIFGNYGFPEMGIHGAAVASVIAEIVSLTYILIYSVIKDEFKLFKLFRFVDVNMNRMKAILHLSSPVILQNTLSMSSYFLFFVLIEHIGEHELAISNVVRGAYMVLMTPMWGYASATNSMVSNLIGQQKGNELKKLVIKIINLSLLTNVALFIITMVEPFWLLKVITSDVQLIEDSIGCYYIVIAAMFIFSVSVVLLSVVSGAGNTKAAMIIEIINIGIYVLYVYICTYILFSSIETVWLAEIVYWILMGVFSGLYLKYGKWREIKI